MAAKDDSGIKKIMDEILLVHKPSKNEAAEVQAIVADIPLDITLIDWDNAESTEQPQEMPHDFSTMGNPEEVDKPLTPPPT